MKSLEFLIRTLCSIPDQFEYDEESDADIASIALNPAATPFVKALLGCASTSLTDGLAAYDILSVQRKAFWDNVSRTFPTFYSGLATSIKHGVTQVYDTEQVLAAKNFNDVYLSTFIARYEALHAVETTDFFKALNEEAKESMPYASYKASHNKDLRLSSRAGAAYDAVKSSTNPLSRPLLLLPAYAKVLPLEDLRFLNVMPGDASDGYNLSNCLWLEQPYSFEAPHAYLLTSAVQRKRRLNVEVERTKHTLTIHIETITTLLLPDKGVASFLI